MLEIFSLNWGRSQINDTHLIVEAAHYNNLNMVKQLVEKQHGNISSSDEYGQIALFAFCRGVCERLWNVVDDKYGWTPFFRACYYNKLECVKKLIT